MSGRPTRWPEKDAHVSRDSSPSSHVDLVLGETDFLDLKVYLYVATTTKNQGLSWKPAACLHPRMNLRCFHLFLRGVMTSAYLWSCGGSSLFPPPPPGHLRAPQTVLLTEVEFPACLLIDLIVCV